ncbi:MULTISPECIES: hypothetical protein [unclassified Mycobacterium]|uniref:hypothetical protein n=1 Tax=unclassified Mycobacterium TaxID=2642494 RepID=UPI0029C7DCF9|nr:MULTISPECIES: hypothetical protein [unclassified Mycobacterium]
MNVSYAAIVISLGSLALGIVNYQYARYAQVRELQAPLRNELRNNLHRFDYWRIGKILNQLRDRVPSGDIAGELHKLGESIALSKGSFVAPTPHQLQTLVDAFESARAALEKAGELPTKDEVFDEGYQAKQRGNLIEHLTVLRHEIRCVVEGLDMIQTKPLTRRKQIKQFKALDR